MMLSSKDELGSRIGSRRCKNLPWFRWLIYCALIVVVYGLLHYSGVLSETERILYFSYAANHNGHVVVSPPLDPISELILNGTLLFPDLFPDCCKRFRVWINKTIATASLEILPVKSRQVRGDCVRLNLPRAPGANFTRASTFFLFQNVGHVIENGKSYLEVYTDGLANSSLSWFIDLQSRYDACPINWHDCDVKTKWGWQKCAPQLRFVPWNATLNNAKNDTVDILSAATALEHVESSLMFVNYIFPHNLWHGMFEELFPIAMTSLLWRRDFFSQPVGWMERRVGVGHTNEALLPILRDLHRILLAANRTGFQERASLERRRLFKYVSVGYARDSFLPVKWEDSQFIYAEPMISFYPCAAKRIRQSYDVSFQPPARERIDPLVVYLERDEDNPNRLEIIKEIADLKLFGLSISCVSVNPRRLSTGEIVRLMASASAVLGTEGAAFSNILFMAPGSGVLVIENREGEKPFPSFFHHPIGRHLNLSYVHLKFVTNNNVSSPMNVANPKKVQQGMELLLRQIEINRGAQLLSGTVDFFMKSFDYYEP